MGLKPRDSFCVYTILIGDYEQLNEQPAIPETKARFICFTDDPALTSRRWEIRIVEPEFQLDLARSTRLLKFRPDRYLPDFGWSLYIDNSVSLKTDPLEAAESLAGEHAFAAAAHSMRDTVLDEFLAVIQMALDDPIRVMEQMNHYVLCDPDVMQEKPFWGGLLVREHHDPEVIKLMRYWMQQVLRYSRRDQLSINFAIRATKVPVHRVDLDHKDSPIHHWGDYPRTQRNSRFRNHAEALLPLQAVVKNSQARQRELESELVALKQSAEQLSLSLDEAHRYCLAALEKKDKEQEDMQGAIRAFMESTSWRITAPLRSLSRATRWRRVL